MECRLIVDGNAVYEIDEECAKQREGKKGTGGKSRGGGFFGQPGPRRGGTQGMQ